MVNYSSIEEAADAALADLGLSPPKSYGRGAFVVVDAKDGRRGNGAGRLKIFADGQGGFAQNWRSGERRAFFLNGGGQSAAVSEQERQRIEGERQKRQAKEAASKGRAARRALALWQAAAPAPADHPYLLKKRIKPHSARVGQWRRVAVDADGNKCAVNVDNALLVPLLDTGGAIRSLQAIFPDRHPLLDRDKDFLPGSALAGLFGVIGSKTEAVIVCEGFATGATLHEQTGHRVYLAFTANNLLAVGQTVRERLPEANLIFAADNDTRTPGNPGLTKATEAAKAVGGALAVPPLDNADFNDYQRFLEGGGNG